MLPWLWLCYFCLYLFVVGSTDRVDVFTLALADNEGGRLHTSTLKQQRVGSSRSMTLSCSVLVVLMYDCGAQDVAVFVSCPAAVVPIIYI